MDASTSAAGPSEREEATVPVFPTAAALARGLKFTELLNTRAFRQALQSLVLARCYGGALALLVRGKRIGRFANPEHAYDTVRTSLLSIERVRTIGVGALLALVRKRGTGEGSTVEELDQAIAESAGRLQACFDTSLEDVDVIADDPAAGKRARLLDVAEPALAPQQQQLRGARSSGPGSTGRLTKRPRGMTDIVGVVFDLVQMSSAVAAALPSATRGALMKRLNASEHATPEAGARRRRLLSHWWAVHLREWELPMPAVGYLALSQVAPNAADAADDGETTELLNQFVAAQKQATRNRISAWEARYADAPDALNDAETAPACAPLPPSSSSSSASAASACTPTGAAGEAGNDCDEDAGDCSAVHDTAFVVPRLWETESGDMSASAVDFEAVSRAAMPVDALAETADVPLCAWEVLQEPALAALAARLGAASSPAAAPGPGRILSGLECRPGSLGFLVAVAARAAARGDQPGAKHGAVLFDRRGRIVCVGFNHSTETHLVSRVRGLRTLRAAGVTVSSPEARAATDEQLESLVVGGRAPMSAVRSALAAGVASPAVLEDRAARDRRLVLSGSSMPEGRDCAAARDCTEPVAADVSASEAALALIPRPEHLVKLGALPFKALSAVGTLDAGVAKRAAVGSRQRVAHAEVHCLQQLTSIATARNLNVSRDRNQLPACAFGCTHL